MNTVSASRGWRDVQPGRLAIFAATVAVATVVVIAAIVAGVARGAAAPPKTFTVAGFTEFNTLDPDQGLSAPQLQVMNLFGGNLVKFTPNGADVTGDLASSWAISKDGLTYVFKLRPGLKFSDGRPLLASDVVATYRRARSDKTNANIGEIYNFKSWRAPNARTVVLRLRYRQGSALSFLADPEVGPVFPARDLAKKNFFLKPISAGPYRVTSFDATTGNTTLEVNSKYYGPKPAIPVVKFVYVADPATRSLQLKSGQVDYAENLDPNTLSQFSGETVPSLNLLEGGFYLVINNRQGPLANVKVRRAISMAVDRDQLNRIIYHGLNKPMTSFWAPSQTGGTNKDLPAFSVAGAKALLAGTPCASGCDFPIMVRGGAPQFQQFATIIQQQLQAIGIKTELQITDPSVANKKAYSGDFQLYTGGLWDYANRPDAMLQYGLIYTGGLFSLYSGYQSPQMVALANKAIALSGKAQAAAISGVGQLFAQDMPYVPLLQDAFANAQRTATVPWVKTQGVFFNFKSSG